MKATIHKCHWIDDKKDVAHYEAIETELSDNVDTRLPQLQKAVGGWIDIYNHEGDDLVINDESLLLGEPLNLWALGKGLQLFGTIVRVHGKLE